MVEAVIVTNQERIKYLKRYVILDREINRKQAEVDKLRTMLVKVTASFSHTPKGGGSIYSKTESVVAKIVELENEINTSIDNLIDIKQSIYRIIESVKDDKERQLLQYRYLDGMTFEWIAGEMFYSWRWIHILHKRAISKVCILVHIEKVI